LYQSHRIILPLDGGVSERVERSKGKRVFHVSDTLVWLYRRDSERNWVHLFFFLLDF
jgi:hypothetical protein